MKESIARVIGEAADEIGLEDVSVRPNYSGRGMFGRTTTAVVAGCHATLLQAVALAAVRIADGTYEGQEGVPTDEEFIEEMGKVVFDSMGRGLVLC
jgi:hypothetical protein